MPQKLIALRNCGVISPNDISSYLKRDGFKALERVRHEMTPDQVIEQVTASGLRGRGGAGFPCGRKWETARKTTADRKYFVCNADEGEPGTFKDRYMLQNDPFSLVEGMVIASYAIGARKAILYLREEYHHLSEHLTSAIEKVRHEGFLDRFSFEITEGAGAYICGEESALIESIEGKRGEPRYRPPFPPVWGLFGKPTVVNNVETIMNIPWIILNGAESFRRMGTKTSKGTKVFSVCGDVKRPGVYEMTFGSTLRELVSDVAGSDDVQMVQMGGAGGRIIPENQLDMAVSYETFVGSGSVVVFDHSRDIIDILYRTVMFFAEESCGKCVPCREGIEVMLEIYHRLSQADGCQGDIAALKDISFVLQNASLCGLGQSVSVPVLSSLEFFSKAYENRIDQSLMLRRLSPVKI